MKKIISMLAIAAVSATLFATPALAATNYSDAVTVGAAYGKATVDGNTSEWKNAKALTITLDDEVVNKYGIYQNEWEKHRANKGDFSTSIKFMWDENALYILEERVDDNAVLKGNAKTPWEGSDGNLMFLQVADSGSDVNKNGYSHHIFYILGNGSNAEGGSTAVRINNQSAAKQTTEANSAIKISAKKTSTGWLAEIMVPWSVFQKEISGFKPTENALLGMSCVPIDTDEAGANQLCWFKQDTQMNVKGGYDYGGWATLKLEAKPAATNPATADLGIIAAVASLISGAAAVGFKKRK